MMKKIVSQQDLLLDDYSFIEGLDITTVGDAIRLSTTLFTGDECTATFRWLRLAVQDAINHNRNLDNAFLVAGRLEGLDFSHYDSKKMTGVDFSHALLAKCNFEGMCFERCNFSNAVMSNMDLSKTTFKDCNLEDVFCHNIKEQPRNICEA